MVYHQWGFPQKMEEILAFAKKNKLFVLEDCAHSFSSFYKSKRVGTFGDESIWSFSKFFPSVVGGAVYTKDAKLLNFVRKSYHKSDVTLEKKVFTHLVHTNKHQTKAALREVARNYAIYPELFTCPPYAMRAVAKELASGALKKRRENFQMLREAFWGKAEEHLLEDSEVCPWVVPLFFGSNNAKVARALQRCGIESGMYHFDTNRNMLEPHFVECVAVPCHQGISDAVIGSMIDIVKVAL
jgi:dTDP-4-amino-4,6-dideoxygalactose transaminase